MMKWSLMRTRRNGFIWRSGRFGLTTGACQHGIRRPAALVLILLQVFEQGHLGSRHLSVAQASIVLGEQVVRTRLVGSHLDDLLQIEESALIVLGFQI